MPNWKKVITSGSDAHLNQITASAFQFIGSGTAELEVQGHITASGNISSSGFVSASSFSGDGAGLTNVSATVADESITLAKLAHAAANTVLVRDANSTGDPSFKAVTNTQILIGDGTGFTAAALSGDVTMTNGGVVTIGANTVEGSMLNTNVAGTGLTVAGNNIDVDAAQTQITSVGTLTGLFVDSHISASGNISASGDITSNTLNVNTSGELTGSYGTLRGAFNINYGSDATSTGSLANGEGYGEIFSHTPLNANVIKGNVVYHTGADWQNADADAESLGGNSMLGVALAAGGGVPGPVLIRGMVRLVAGHIDDTSGDEGDAVYLSTTTGHVQFAQPSGTGDIVRVVGYCINEADDIIYFNPSSTFVEHA